MTRARLSFCLLARQDAAGIARAYRSIWATAEPGDEVVALVDGSGDETATLARRFVAEHGCPEAVDHRVISLGSRTPGDLGILANLALAAATRELVAFVPGRGVVDTAGLRAARAAIASADAEVWVAGLTLLQGGAEPRTVSDPPELAPDPYTQALARIPSLWRSVIRRQLIERTGFRFAEGGSGAEIRAHWDLVRRARGVGVQRMPVAGIDAPVGSFDAAALMREWADVGRTIGPVRRRTRFIALRACLWQLDEALSFGPPQSSAAFLAQGRRAMRGVPPWVWRLGNPAPARIDGLVRALRSGRKADAFMHILDLAIQHSATTTSAEGCPG